MAIDFFNLPGPCVLFFSDEGADALLFDTPSQVADYLFSPDCCGWSDSGTFQELIDCLNDEDNWQFDEGRKPFWWTMDIGEITRAHVLIGVGKGT